MLDFKDLVDHFQQSGLLNHIEKEVTTHLELASIISGIGPAPVIFTNISDHEFPVVANVFSSRKSFSMAHAGKHQSHEGEGESVLPATNPDSFIHRLQHAIKNCKAPSILDENSEVSCQEIIHTEPDLDKLPILKHVEEDGGRYITSGVAIYTCPRYGGNMSFHRMMIIDDGKMVARVVENRGLDTALKESGGELEVAIAIGNAPQVMIAASTSPPKGVDELSIANALSPIELVKCKTIDVMVPAGSEIIIEGHFTGETADEGPFLDLTGTLDIIRNQPVFEVTCMTHRRNPMYHALLPASKEHELLMGLPREATMARELGKHPGFRDVRLTDGSAHWFNAVVQFEGGRNLDPEEIFKSTFLGHGSLKNCIIIDDDIEIADPLDVEFAITTRCQFTEDLYLFPNERGSSLDPSANQVTRETCKVGIDATIPRGKDRQAFMKKRLGRER
ncbi:UbiD family decarboxylase [Candidatus Bathyarchaeota archaeon]|nr:UbiD family decarboxylase [Candidatus Bathyarchaeota archaeon]